MTKRSKNKDRCERCYMRYHLCICSMIPSLDLATRVVVVISHRERLAPSNTGRLAGVALRNSMVLTRGNPAEPYELSDHLMPHRPSLLLYPTDDAPELSTEFLQSMGGGPFNLVVPDGNWRQACKMRRRDPAMAAMPVVKLPAGAPTAYRIRREPKAGGMATIEAIARALGIMEGEAVQKALEEILEAKVIRTLASRGTAQQFYAPEELEFISKPQVLQSTPII